MMAPGCAGEVRGYGIDLGKDAASTVLRLPVRRSMVPPGVASSSGCRSKSRASRAMRRSALAISSTPFANDAFAIALPPVVCWRAMFTQ